MSRPAERIAETAFTEEASMLTKLTHTARGYVVISAFFVSGQIHAEGVRVVPKPPTDARNPLYVGNRAPLRPTPLIKLPVGSIQPRGWLRKQLDLQRAGFHGHLGEISRFLEKDGNAWLDASGEGEHGWEEPPYWLKGFAGVGYVLRDDKILAEAREWVDAALASQQPDGWFGPDRGRSGAATRLEGRDDLWPNMIMLFCLQDYHEYTRDPRVLKLMTAYFRYLRQVPEDRFLLGYWPKIRGGDLLFSVYWLFNRTGDVELLELAKKVHRRTADWTSGVINWHNVNMAQAFGQPTTFWMQSGEARHLEASERNFRTIRERYGQVPGGLFGGDENCRPGFTDPRQAVETCGMTEMMLSTETLVGITGDLVWADRCEDVAFNSLPAALTADLKALRYLTAPNMPLSDRRSKSPGLQNGGPMLHMNPHIHRCCQHNWGHAWPYLAQHLWFATSDRGVAAVFYGASEVAAWVGGGVEISLVQSTRYPFDDRVDVTVKARDAVRFPLYLRVPGWCRSASVTVNNRAVAVEAKPLHFVRIEREWAGGDRVVLTLPMEIDVRTWNENKGSVSVDRGPLTYSLKIGERFVRAGGTDEWPAWEILPTTPWNYGLVLDSKRAKDSFEIVRREWPESDMPFSQEGTPIELRARGKRIAGWQIDRFGLAAPLQQSPVRSEEDVESLTLIPMGAARLRIAAFPVIGEGETARRWKGPPRPRKPAYRPTASHCYGGDTVEALADGIVPSSSGDHSIPRMTWWDRRGSSEWAQAEFDAPRTVSAVEIYWFDDRGIGACRVPASWTLSYRRDGRWSPVVPIAGQVAYGVERDRFNRLNFEEVETDAFRIDTKLRPEFSSGILEWSIGERVVFDESFEDELADGWEWLREHPGFWRRKDGALEIRAEPGLAHNVRNALVRRAPDRRRGKFAIHLTVTNTTEPTQQYEQAGITWYRGGKPVFKLVKELVDGRPLIVPGFKPVATPKVELRLVVDADSFVAQYRARWPRSIRDRGDRGAASSGERRGQHSVLPRSSRRRALDAIRGFSCRGDSRGALTSS